MKSRIYSLSIIFSFLLFPNFYAQNNFNLQKISNEADIIITGIVTKVNSQWDMDKKNIWTYITIAPDEYLKGKEKTKEITIKLIGGIVGEIGMEVSGVPEFKTFERTLLFLKEDAGGNYKIADWDQGKFTYSNKKWINKRINIEDPSLNAKIKEIMQP